MNLIPGLDYKDQFQKAHQTRGKPRSTWAKRARNIPAWTLSDGAVKKLLQTTFPKMLSDTRQRDRAGRWASTIYLYFRAARPASEVAHELKISEKTVYDTVLRIRRAAKGLRTTGRKRTTGKPGRPRRQMF
jgi:hypothetical protein